MCLTISIMPSGIDRAAAIKIASAVSAAAPLAVSVSRGLLARLKSDTWLLVSEAGDECACSLLSDDASWDDEAWLFRDDVPGVLAETMRILGSHLGTPFEVECLWAGDEVERTVALSLDEFIEQCARGEVGNKTLYRVKLESNG